MYQSLLAVWMSTAKTFPGSANQGILGILFLNQPFRKPFPAIGIVYEDLATPLWKHKLQAPSALSSSYHIVTREY